MMVGFGVNVVRREDRSLLGTGRRTRRVDALNENGFGAVILLTMRTDLWVGWVIVEAYEDVYGDERATLPEAATAWATGFVKWDGCTEVSVLRSSHHMCGPDELAHKLRMFGQAYYEAAMMMGDRFDGSTAELSRLPRFDDAAEVKG